MQPWEDPFHAGVQKRYGSVIAPPKGKAKGIDPYEYRRDFACDAKSSNAGSAIGCSKAYDCSPKVGPDGKPMRGVRVQAFRKLKADPKDPWRAVAAQRRRGR